MRFPRLFPRNKKQVALSPAPGHYSNDDPEKIIFDQGTRLRVEANHWKTFCFILAIIAGGAVYTRQPPPSVADGNPGRFKPLFQAFGDLIGKFHGEVMAAARA